MFVFMYCARDNNTLQESWSRSTQANFTISSKEKRKTAPQRNVMGTNSATNNREQSNQTEANDDTIKKSQETSAQASKSKVP